MAEGSQIVRILRSCESGDIEVIRELIDKGADLDETDESGTTGLQVAAANDQVNIVKLLLDHGVAVNLSNSSGWSPMHHACIHGHNEVVHLLLKAKASTTIRNKFGATPLNVASAGGHLSTVKILVREGVLHEEETRSQFPDCPLPLATASLFRNDSVLKYFLESKGQDDWVNLEIPDTGWTPLMFASGIGNRRAVQLLLDHGANADAINVHNMNALDLAQDNIKGLLEAYTKIPTLTVQDENVLENVTFLEACRIGDVEVVAELISENPDLDVNATDPVEGATGLMLVAIGGHVELAKMLIGLGANLNAKDPIHGWTALMQATFFGQREVAKILLKSGADPTIAANNGCTALDLATLVEETDTSIIRLLANETITIAPPVLAFMPISRPPSASLQRSVSMAALPSKSASAKSKKSSGGGLKAWWNKFSMRFKGVKKAEEVRINIIPDEPDVQSIIISEAGDDDHDPEQDGDNRPVFTLGFSAATKDLPTNCSSLTVQAPEILSIVPDEDLDQFARVSTLATIGIPDTTFLLKNFQSRGRKQRTISIDSTASKFNSSSSSIKSTKSKSGKNKSLNDFRPRSSSLPRKRSSRKRRSLSSRRRPKDVKSLLKSISMTEYTEAFERHEIDLDAFKELGEADLIEIGVKKQSARKKILDAIKQMSVQ